MNDLRHELLCHTFQTDDQQQFRHEEHAEVMAVPSLRQIRMLDTLLHLPELGKGRPTSWDVEFGRGVDDSRFLRALI